MEAATSREVARHVLVALETERILLATRERRVTLRTGGFDFGVNGAHGTRHDEPLESAHLGVPRASHADTRKRNDRIPPSLCAHELLDRHC